MLAAAASCGTSAAVGVLVVWRIRRMSALWSKQREVGWLASYAALDVIPVLSLSDADSEFAGSNLRAGAPGVADGTQAHTEGDGVAMELRTAPQASMGPQVDENVTVSVPPGAIEEHVVEPDRHDLIAIAGSDYHSDVPAHVRATAALDLRDALAMAGSADQTLETLRRFREPIKSKGSSTKYGSKGRLNHFGRAC